MKRKLLVRVILIGLMSAIITACGAPKTQVDKPLTKESQNKGEKSKKADEAIEVGKTIEKDKVIELEEATEEELYIAFKNKMESVATNSQYAQMMPSSVVVDLDGDGVLELLLATTDLNCNRLIMQVYDYDGKKRECYLSDEMEFGIGSRADGSAYYSLYKNEDYLISVSNGLDNGEYHTLITYNKGKFKEYSRREHKILRGWSEDEKKDIFKDTVSYLVDSKECTKPVYEEAVKGYEQVLGIACTTYGTDEFIDETDGSKDFIERYKELTNNQGIEVREE